LFRSALSPVFEIGASNLGPGEIMAPGDGGGPSVQGLLPFDNCAMFEVRKLNISRFLWNVLGI
jgi:hypothetical protein